MAHHGHLSRHRINIGNPVRILRFPQPPQRQGRSAILTARHVTVDPLNLIGLDDRSFITERQRLLSRKRGDRCALLVQPLHTVVCLHTDYELANKALLNHNFIGRHQSGLQL